LIHFTYYLPGFLGRFGKLPKVVTLYDMIPENTKREKLWNPHFSKKRYLSRSNSVLSISNSSTMDMRREYGFQFPVATSYLGVGKEFRPSLQKPSWAPNKYALYVGKRRGYKNWNLAAIAFSKVARKHPDLNFLLLGGGPLSMLETTDLEKLGIGDQVVQIQASDHELPNLYSNAEVLLYPSHYEGFGLPLVEAMASGLPILASDTPINHEVCDKSAIYFDRNSANDLAASLTLLLDDENLRDALSASGIEQAKRYTWYQCAVETAKLYKSTVHKERG
jgi:glycosyltransferase involved in cell wall biosynthesis